MIVKPIDQITEQDLQTLVDNAVLERKSLEYKQLLPGNSDADKKEYLADVSSFANSSGGDLLFGIVSDNSSGIPQKIEGMDLTNVDQEISRLDNSIRDGIEPRISGIAIRSIPLSNSKTVIIIRVQKSWNLPHRVTYKGHDKFYSRSTNGKYPLDVNELRNAFNLSSSIAEKIRKFREERIAKILSNDTPVSLLPDPKFVLHVIPVISFNPAQLYNISEIPRKPHKLRPIDTGAWDDRYNIDGFLTYSTALNGKYYSYTQLFKNGIIEAVDASMMEQLDNRLLIPSVLFERELIDSLDNYLLLLRELGVQLPAYAFLSVLGVRGYTMATKGWLRQAPLIDRDNLLVPECIIEQYNVDSKDILRPCFDSIWNACGFPHSLNYNEKGEWVV
jgi:hypothetical protein